MTCEHDRVTVLFDSEGYRTLSLEAIAESGVLTVDDAGRPDETHTDTLPAYMEEPVA